MAILIFQDMSALERLLDRYGLPITFLLVVIIAIWLVAKRAGPLVTGFIVGLEARAANSLAQALDLYRERLLAADERIKAADERNRLSQEQFLQVQKEQAERHAEISKMQAEYYRQAMDLQTSRLGEGLAQQTAAIREIQATAKEHTQAVRELGLQIQRK